jgi:peptidoglycan/xylan/chitin deacetylase (PgdA/CDA1 family)
MLRVTGLGRALLALPCWRGTVILSYHRIGDARRSELHHGVFTVAPEAFDAQLRLLRRHFEVIDPASFEPRPRSSDQRRPPRGRRVMVTFDDGYRDLYEHAAPLLREHGVRAAVFLSSGLIDGSATAWWDEIAWMVHRAERTELAPGAWSPAPMSLAPAARERTIETVIRAYWELAPERCTPFLDRLAAATGAGHRPARAAVEDWITWEMARELRDAGHVVGAHTVTHPVLARLPRAAQLREIAGSIERIEAELGDRPRWLAYPVGVAGAVDADTLTAARDAGVEVAFANGGGYLAAAPADPLALPRVSVESRRDPALFAATLALPQLFA